MIELMCEKSGKKKIYILWNENSIFYVKFMQWKEIEIEIKIWKQSRDENVTW
mgnify:CR=1 FL=1